MKRIRPPTYIVFLCMPWVLGLSLLVASQAEQVKVGSPGAKVMPDFTLDRCINADTLRLSDYREQPVLLFFFDAGDVASINVFRYVREWHRRYAGDGLRILGIHCPEFEPSKAMPNVAKVVGAAEISFPVGMDVERDVYRAYSLKALPTFVVLRPGSELASVETTLQPKFYERVEKAIQKTLRDMKPDIIHPFLLKPMRPEDDPDAKILPASPRIVLGYSSGAVEGCDSTDFGKYKVYTDSRDREKGKVYLQGEWKVDQYSISHEATFRGPESYVRVIYAGKDVWVLPNFEYGKVPRVYIKQDRSYLHHDIWGRDVVSDEMGRPHIQLRYAIPRHIVSNRSYGTHELQLIPTQGEISFHYFFFEGDVEEQASQR